MFKYLTDNEEGVLDMDLTQHLLDNIEGRIGVESNFYYSVEDGNHLVHDLDEYYFYYTIDTCENMYRISKVTFSKELKFLSEVRRSFTTFNELVNYVIFSLQVNKAKL